MTETPGDFDALVKVLQQRSDLRPARKWLNDTCVAGDCEIPDDVVPVNKSNLLRQTFAIEENMQKCDL